MFDPTFAARRAQRLRPLAGPKRVRPERHAGRVLWLFYFGQTPYAALMLAGGAAGIGNGSNYIPPDPETFVVGLAMAGLLVVGMWISALCVWEAP